MKRKTFELSGNVILADDCDFRVKKINKEITDDIIINPSFC